MANDTQLMTVLQTTPEIAKGIGLGLLVTILPVTLMVIFTRTLVRM